MVAAAAAAVVEEVREEGVALVGGIKVVAVGEVVEAAAEAVVATIGTVVEIKAGMVEETKEVGVEMAHGKIKIKVSCYMLFKLLCYIHMSNLVRVEYIQGFNNL